MTKDIFISSQTGLKVPFDENAEKDKSYELHNFVNTHKHHKADNQSNFKDCNKDFVIVIFRSRQI